MCSHSGKSTLIPLRSACGLAGNKRLRCLVAQPDLASYQGTLGAGTCLLDKYWAVAQRNAGRACWPVSERRRAHSLAETHPVASDAPSDEPPNREGAPALPPHVDCLGGRAIGNFRGDPAGKRQRGRAQLELRGCDLGCFAGVSPQSGDS